MRLPDNGSEDISAAVVAPGLVKNPECVSDLHDSRSTCTDQVLQMPPTREIVGIKVSFPFKDRKLMILKNNTQKGRESC